MGKNKILSGAFAWLFLGLLICFITSYVTSMSYDIINFIYGGYKYLILLAVELGLAIFLSLRIFKMKPLTAIICYLLYTILTGVTLTGILLVYTKESIYYVFLATALIFGSFALIGRYTKTDMTKWGIYLVFAIIAIVILEVVNIFLMNNTLNMILAIVGILVFCAFTAYDVQKALHLSESIPNASIYCAFSLFLDFINLFIDLIRLFGKKNN